jgi:hypothetical protein
MEEKIKDQEKMSKKRSLEGTNLSDCNSFVVLDDEHIAKIAEGMGVIIPCDKFDSIDILKDIEVARHVLDKKENCDPYSGGRVRFLWKLAIIVMFPC